jgi:hypothetical protein
MSDEPQKIGGNPVPTEGFPIVYTNLASVTANYNDLRIYFADTYAKTIATVGTTTTTQGTVSEANIAPRICMVLTPEFAKSLLDALSGTLALYEKQFGPLRPAPQLPTSNVTPKPASR